MTLDSQLCNTWPIDRENGCWDVPATVTEARILFMQRAASDYLWARTGRRLGPSCPVTVRPCRKTCFEGYGYGRFLNQGQYQSTGGWIPYMFDGQMRNATLCGCQSECHCGPELCEIRLPGPVFDVTDVRINGLVVDSATYRVDDGQYLTRITTGAAADEERCWPSCQDMTRRESEENTFAVTYRSGLGLSGLATLAVTEMTAHLIRGCAGCGDGCGGGNLRQNLRSKSRQGIDLEFVDPQTVFNDDRTGIEVVDWFIKSQNPYGLGSQLRVISPDAPKRPRIQGPVA